MGTKLNRQEFEKLALEQLDAVDRVARSLTRNPAESDDLVQETFLRAVRAADTFQLESYGIRPWLFRILHNLHNTRAARESRQPVAVEMEYLQSMDDGGEQAPTAVIAGHADSEVDQAMSRLPAELQSALTLWAIDELSYKQIAEVMDVPIGTVMSRLHRARQRLSQSLRNLAPKPRLRTELE